jgi:hypothetical protein
LYFYYEIIGQLDTFTKKIAAKMKILKFKFQDKSSEWFLKETDLLKLTLLVGASGVGKTQILRAIHAIKEIADGDSINGVNWYVEFETIDNLNFIWEGEFEKKGKFIFDDDDDENQKNKPKILSETLTLNNEVIVKRDSKKILFKNLATLKLPQQESIISILKEEDLIKPAYIALKKIHFSDNSDSIKEPFKIHVFNANKLAKKYNTLKKIQESDFDIRVKLYLAFKNDIKTFNKIQDRFIDIFPQVEEIKIAPIEIKDEDVPSYIKDYPFIQIKEKGLKDWISQSRISSGMFRSLIHISELYLCSEGTLFLIDEFENSLGINCIDELTSDIMKSKRELQFVLTSHHPYIINSIPFENWKLVTRNAGIVKTHDLTKYNLGKSKHEKFMQLIQLDQYQTGEE